MLVGYYHSVLNSVSKERGSHMTGDVGLGLAVLGTVPSGLVQCFICEFKTISHIYAPNLGK
jgi:hypothetical protein